MPSCNINWQIKTIIRAESTIVPMISNHPFVCIFCCFTACTDTLIWEIDTIETMQAAQRSRGRHNVASFSAHFWRSCVITLVHIAVVSAHPLVVHAYYVPVISARISFLILVVIIIISVVAAGPYTWVGTMDSRKLLRFWSVWLTTVHFQLPNLVLRCSQILEDALYIVVWCLSMVWSLRASILTTDVVTTFDSHVSIGWWRNEIKTQLTGFDEVVSACLAPDLVLSWHLRSHSHWVLFSMLNLCTVMDYLSIWRTTYHNELLINLSIKNLPFTGFLRLLICIWLLGFYILTLPGPLFPWRYDPKLADGRAGTFEPGEPIDGLWLFVRNSKWEIKISISKQNTMNQIKRKSKNVPVTTRSRKTSWNGELLEFALWLFWN